MKLKKKYDVIVIGSGLGGLTAGLILAKEGMQVCILEKNNQYGGNLQTFVRDRTIFDTGVHYIGGLSEGQNMYQYFKYLGIMDDLKLKRLDEDGYDIISFENDPGTYRHAQGFELFKKTLLKDFPKEEEAINRYCNKIQETTTRFPMFHVQVGDVYTHDPELFNLSIKKYLDSITNNHTLKAVLAGSNLLYAGKGDSTPFFVHALSVHSYITSAYRCINGGSQISKFLVRRLIEKGSHIFKHQEVTHIEIVNDRATTVTTAKGDRISADTIISNVDPKITLKWLDESVFRKSFTNRINNIENTVSAFSIHIVLKPKTFPYKNHNYYHFKDKNRVWEALNYTQESWPETYMISMGPKKDMKGWADNLTVMTYMHYEELKPWENTFNTVSKKNDRGQTYEEFKAKKAEQLLDEVQKKFPNIRECIQAIYTTTPLSYRDYIGSETGAMYGYEKSVNKPMQSFISPRTKVKNLLFTGQSTNMHGILGVTISGVNTASELLGKEYVMAKIWKANKD